MGEARGRQSHGNSLSEAMLRTVVDALAGRQMSRGKQLLAAVLLVAMAVPIGFGILATIVTVVGNFLIRDAYKDDLLHAVFTKDYATIENLAGATDVNARRVLPGGYPTTALHFAAFKLDPRAVRLLLKAGGDPDLQDDEGMTPLGTVLCYRKASDTERDLVEVAAVLLEFGADPLYRPESAIDEWSAGETAAEYARSKGYAELAALLDGASVHRAE